MGRLSIALFVGLAFVASSLAVNLQALSEKPLGPADPAVIRKADPGVVEELEMTAAGVDVADLQNVEDEPQAVTVRCSAGEEYVRDPRHCRRYFQCSNGIPYELKCPKGLYFDLVRKVCDYPQNVDCRGVRDRTIRRRIGRFSGPGNDRESTVSCPPGYVPVGCEASDPRVSDGTVVKGRNCSVFNSGKNNLKRGQRAITTCARADDDEFVFIRSGGFEPQPVAQCPFNYRIINCFLRNAWAQETYVFPVINAGKGSCAADIPCTAGRGCFTQAVCRLRNIPLAEP